MKPLLRVFLHGIFVEAVVAIGSGIVAHSLALTAFGADSIIELVAGGILLWRLYVESNGANIERVQQAEKRASHRQFINILTFKQFRTKYLVDVSPTTGSQFWKAVKANEVECD